MRAVQGGGQGGGGGPFRGPNRSPFAAGGGGGGDPGDHGQPGHSPFRGPPSFAAPHAPTAAEQFRETISLVRTASNAAREFQSMFQGQTADSETGVTPIEADDSPVRLIDTGRGKLVIDKRNGSLRAVETGFANMGSILGWVSEQIEIARKHAPQAPALPPGYVDTGVPGYQPPPGMVAVPLNQPQPSYGPPLPQPPSQMPPPLGAPAPQASPPVQVARPAPPPPAPAQPPPRRTWAAPTIPGQE